MNVVIVKEWVWGEKSIEDVAHPARMLAPGTLRSRARAKLERSAGSQRWWVLDLPSSTAGGECGEMG